MYYRTVPTRTRGRGGGCSGRLLIAAAIAAFSLFSYFSSRQDNPVTGETQYIDITPEQEIALGLEAGAARDGERPGGRGQACLPGALRRLGRLIRLHRGGSIPGFGLGSGAAIPGFGCIAGQGNDPYQPCSCS